MQYVLSVVAAGVVFLAIDLAWLGVIARDFYRTQMSELIAPAFNLPAASAFYVIYLIGLMYFAIVPALSGGSIVTALVRGAAFGFFCYATYDLTNLAVMRDYPPVLAVVDIAWGVFLTMMASGAGYLGGRLAT